MKKKAVKTTTIVTFVLDETGSMESIKDDTIGGFNAYLDSLRDEKHGAVEFSLVKFDSNKIDKVYVGAPIADVKPLTKETYRPGASTPLIDASYKAIKATEEAVAKRKDKPNILVVIQTDGQENASTQFKFSDLSALIKEKTAAGWLFVFLGAGIDAFAIGAQMGISASTTASYARTNSAQTFAAMARNTAQYRATGLAATMAFADDQRAAMGGQQTPPAPTTPTRTHRTQAVEDFSL